MKTTAFVVKGKGVISAWFVVLALAAAGLAWAECPPGETFPADNEETCEALGGTFTQTGSLKTCVIHEGLLHVTCERPENNPFSADISTVTRTYTRQGNECGRIKALGEILACYNSRGHQTSVNACAGKGCLPE
jgi:hypothetical protein